MNKCLAHLTVLLQLDEHRLAHRRLGDLQLFAERCHSKVVVSKNVEFKDRCIPVQQWHFYFDASFFEGLVERCVLSEGIKIEAEGVIQWA